MKYGKLQVTTDYGDGFTSSATYKVYYFVNEGTDVTCLVDVNSVDNSAQFFYGVDVTTNPQGIFGSSDNVTFTWIEQPTVVGCFVEHGDNLNDFTETGRFCSRSPLSDSFIVSNVPDGVSPSSFALEVLKAGGGEQVIQIVVKCSKDNPVTFIRVKYSGSWGGWKLVSAYGSETISSFTSNWEAYNESGTPVIKKDCRTVFLTGVLKNKNAITLNANGVATFTIPEGYRPSKSVFAICNGSGMNRWLIEINPNGNVYFSRYGITEYASVSAGSWFPFSVSWVVD